MKQLIFVYNADGGLFSSLTGFAHKIISPSTYNCQLCALTYSHFSMKKEWQLFIQQLPAESIFLHKDEWDREHHLSTELPAVFIRDNALHLFLSAVEIRGCTTLQQLQELITVNLTLHDKHHHTHL